MGRDGALLPGARARGAGLGARTWDSKSPKKFPAALIADAGKLATHLKRNHPELRDIVSDLQPDLRALTGRTPKGALRPPSNKAKKRPAKKKDSGKG